MLFVFNKDKVRKRTNKAKKRFIKKQYKAIRKVVNMYASKGIESIKLREDQVNTNNIAKLRKKGFKVRKVGIDVIIKW